MNYQTFEPGAELSDFVKCYWTLESRAEVPAQRQRIVPDGCMEMIFHYGDLYRQYLENETHILQPRCFVFGQLTGPLEIEPTGETGIFSVRFHPEGFSPFATIPLKQMENRAVPLAELFGEAGSDLEETILKAESTNEKIAQVESFLTTRLESPETTDRIVKSAIETIITGNGQLSVNELSREMKIHRKQLERKFAAGTGLNPKQLSRIIRLQATLKMLADRKFSNLTSAAHEGDYYDQAHFIKDFKEFTGLTPKKFYGDNLKMTTLFFTTD